MSHKAVREFIGDIARSLRDDVKFGYGRSSDFNQIKDKKFPYIWLDPLSSTTEINTDAGYTISETYTCNLVFYRFDSPDSTENQYKLILDETDKLVQEFIRKTNDDLTAYTELSNTLNTHNTSISAISKQAVIKVMTDCLTGWVLTFNLTVPDTFDYCSEYDS
jgi:hypothetical protein